MNPTQQATIDYAEKSLQQLPTIPMFQKSKDLI